MQINDDRTTTLGGLSIFNGKEEIANTPVRLPAE
jgi:hypothetical protein